jgi:hypothetical protein
MKRYTYKKECFQIYIRVGSNINFYEKIGFTIKRKQRRLENCLRRRQDKESVEASGWRRVEGRRPQGSRKARRKHPGQMMDENSTIMLKSYIAHSDFSRKPWISLKHNDKTEKQFRRHKTPTTPRQEENNLLSGDVLRGFRSSREGHD